MKLEVLTPELTLFKGRVSAVSVPGKKGSFTVLQNHAPIISTLSKGEIELTSLDEGIKNIAIDGGIIEVHQNNIIILVDM